MSYTRIDLPEDDGYEPWYGFNIGMDQFTILGWLRKKNRRICRNPFWDFHKTFFKGSSAIYGETETNSLFGTIAVIDQDGVTIDDHRINWHEFVRLNYEL